MKNNISQIGISFVLFTLLLFKVASFHVYTHHDDTSDAIENCSVCDVAIENQNSDYLLVASQVIDLPLTNIIIQEEYNTYKPLLSSSYLRFSFFGRPPPQGI